jgi:hypothetical protein
MAHYNFDKDLKDGHLAEEEVIARLKDRFKVREEDIERCADRSFDIRIRNSGMTFEVKHDMKAMETGNIAIEYETRGKPSGLATTIADFWIYKFGKMYWVVSTSKLRQKLFKEKIFFKDVTGGDAGSGTRMYLVKTESFKSWGKQL